MTVTTAPPGASRADVADLTVSGLTKRYDPDGHVAVDNLDLTFRHGELVCLLGPSGCGKTTTLRMLAGLVQATAGSIHVAGKEITHLPPERRNMGVVFQQYALFPHLNVEQNVRFGLDMRKVPRAEIAPRISRALQLVDMGHLATRAIRELSGGQQQRVALARALVIEPSILLLDEPLSNLDAKLRAVMRHEIRTIQQRLGITTVFVTHDQEEALSMSDRIAVLHEGRLQQVGTPQEIYETPANLFVAQFMGQSTVLDGRVRSSEQGGRTLVDVDGIGQFWTRAGGHRDGQDVVALIRPQSIRLGEDTTPGRVRVEGHVSDVAYLGEAVEYRVRVGERSLLVKSDTSAGTHAIGDSVTVTFGEDDVVVFDRAQAGDAPAAEAG